MEKVVIGVNDQKVTGDEKTEFDYSQRSQWLRAAVLGANDGLVSTASLMMGVGAVKQEIKAMMLSGFAGLMAGACSMAIGEFVSVYSQLEIEVAQLKREKMRGEEGGCKGEENGGGQLPRPFQRPSASAMAFTVGAIVPLLSAAFVREYWVRVGVVGAVSSVALVVFGATGAVLGRSPVARSTVRVLIGGWAAMLLTFGLMKLVGSRVDVALRP